MKHRQLRLIPNMNLRPPPLIPNMNLRPLQLTQNTNPKPLQHIPNKKPLLPLQRMLNMNQKLIQNMSQ